MYYPVVSFLHTHTTIPQSHTHNPSVSHLQFLSPTPTISQSHTHNPSVPDPQSLSSTCTLSCRHCCSSDYNYITVTIHFFLSKNRILCSKWCALCSATPIVRALDLGAEVVITGRCVDSALTLGPLMHEVSDWSCDLMINEINGSAVRELMNE